MFFFFWILVANPKPVCSYKVLKECVAPERQLLMELHDKVKKINCACPQNCEDADVYTYKSRELAKTAELLGSNGGIVLVREYPMLRYKRKILFSLTDLYGKLINL